MTIKESVNKAYSKIFLAEFSEGDIVATPNGTGVVSAAMTENFEFPDDQEIREIEVDSTAYVDGFVEESGVYTANDLEHTDLDEKGKTSGESKAFVSGGPLGDNAGKLD